METNDKISFATKVSLFSDINALRNFLLYGDTDGDRNLSNLLSIFLRLVRYNKEGKSFSFNETMFEHVSHGDRVMERIETLDKILSQSQSIFSKEFGKDPLFYFDGNIFAKYNSHGVIKKILLLTGESKDQFVEYLEIILLELEMVPSNPFSLDIKRYAKTV